MIHFDTNFLIQTLVAGSPAHEKFRAWIQAQEDCNASSIAWAEFLCGPLDAPAEAIARQIFPNLFCLPMPCWPPACSTRQAAVPAASPTA
jgi:predicted nucleic acid-binding protein